MEKTYFPPKKKVTLAAQFVPCRTCAGPLISKFLRTRRSNGTNLPWLNSHLGEVEVDV